MWLTPEQIGLTDQKEISTIVEGLWADEQSRSKNSCPDCGVQVGEKHDENCDVARCTSCGGQRLSCDCQDGESDIWTGLWPGVETAYKHKLICKWGYDGQWSFDLNRAAIVDQES